jgi:hypothetical protein
MICRVEVTAGTAAGLQCQRSNSNLDLRSFLAVLLNAYRQVPFYLFFI